MPQASQSFDTRLRPAQSLLRRNGSGVDGFSTTRKFEQHDAVAALLLPEVVIRLDAID
jgi:hypothetical protein